MERLVEVKNAEIDQLQADRQLVIASHRMIILAVAEMGGFSKWKRLFEGYQATIDTLERMEAIPSGEVVTLPPRKS